VEGRKKLLSGECEKLLVGKNDAPCHAGLENIKAKATQVRNTVFADIKSLYPCKLLEPSVGLSDTVFSPNNLFNTVCCK
jgi:hypothetical protein